MATEVFYFSSPTCPPCQTIKPTIQELHEDYGHVPWTLVNTSVSKDVADRMNVSLIPTMLIVKNGSEVARHSGSMMMGYYSLLRRYCADTLAV